MAGYSGTPLWKKLGIKPGDAVLAINPPAHYAKLMMPLPDEAHIVTKAPKTGAPIVHLFVASRAELERKLPLARKAMTIDGALWVSWIKQAAKIPTDVTEGAVRNLALAGDLVDVKVCAVDETWSGLKLVVRKSLR